MKAAFIFLIVIVIIAAYSFFNYFLKDWDFPDYLKLQEKAAVSEIIKEKPSNPQPSSPQPSSPQPSNPQPNNSQKEENNPKEKTDVSPYFGKVEISKIQAQSYYNTSLIGLSFWLREGDKINVTGWKIKARKGQIIIPQAIEKYQPYGTPRDIIIEKYGSIYLIGSSNPFGRDKNFRLNKCFGYFLNYQKFYPSFYTYCPKPKLEEISHLNPYCQEYVLNLSSCQIPDYSNNLKIATDYQCVSFLIDNFSYSKCFEKHSQDQDFLMNSWYIYTNTDIVEPLHDTIYLLDKDGLIVDKYLY